jgi:tight adherence protein B
MDTLVLVAAICAAATVALVSYGVWTIVSAEQTRVAWRVSRTGIGLLRRPATQSADVRVQGRSRAMFQPVDRALSKYTWAEKMRLQLQKAEINLHLSEFLAIRILATAAVGVITLVLLFTGADLLYVAAAAGLTFFVWWQIGAYVRRRISRRKTAVERHLDQALVNIAGSLRAGFSFPQACQMSLRQLEWPLNQEFQEMLEEVNVGASMDDALRHMAERIESYEVDITVNAVLVQRQVGGSLAEILDNVAKTIRERRELRGQLMALTAQQRLSAYFVAGVPVLMAGFMSLVNWEFMRPMFTTVVGNVLLVIGAIFDMLGFLVMRRLTRIDF